MYGIRKRQQKYPDLIKQDVVVLDEVFWQLLRGNYNEKNREIIDVALMAYVNGKSPKMGKSWKGANALYFVSNIGDNHWITIKVDLINLELVVYDCNFALNSEKKMDDHMVQFQKMIPLLLRESGYFNHISEYNETTWQYRRPRNIPQSSS